MRFSYIDLIAILLVVIAVTFSGCSSSSPATPATPAATSTPGAGSPAGSSAAATTPTGSTGSTGTSVSGADLFGGLSYNWVEYKMTTGSGNEAMTIYYKYDRVTGKCTMRFEGPGAANLPANMQTMDCTANGGTQSQSNPNQVSSDAQISCAPLEETVVVPAGTFSATKCTITSKDGTSTSWVARGRFMVKMESSTSGGSVNMVLNSYG
jgi:hypothetical protein